MDSDSHAENYTKEQPAINLNTLHAHLAARYNSNQEHNLNRTRRLRCQKKNDTAMLGPFNWRDDNQLADKGLLRLDAKPLSMGLWPFGGVRILGFEGERSTTRDNIEITLRTVS